MECRDCGRDMSKGYGPMLLDTGLCNGCRGKRGIVITLDDILAYADMMDKKDLKNKKRK